MLIRSLLTFVAVACITLTATAQDEYYYSDTKLNLAKDLHSYIIHTTSGDAVHSITANKIAGLEQVESYPHKSYAVLHFAEPITDAKTLSSALGLRDELRDISPGYTFDDGYTIYPTHTVVYRPKRKSDLPAIQALVSSLDVVNTTEKFGTFRVEIKNVADAFHISNTIYESGLVAFAHPDFYSPKKSQADPLFNQQFQMHNTGQTIDGYAGTADMDCNALEAWGVTLGSSNITVAVIDDGLESHEDLRDGNNSSRIIGGYSPANNGNGGTTSSSNHGVACAGIVGASHNNIGVQGVAPLVKMLSVNIFVGGESTQDIADGITWAKNNGADVMSNSWGYTSCTANYSNINNAIADAVNNGRGGKGTVIIFASGNGYKTCVDYPANNSNVIAVGAFTNQGNKSNYSNAGSALDIAAPSNAVSPQPGAGVRTTDRMGSSGYGSGNYTNGFGGTSAACPVVAGVAALVLGYNPNLTDAQVKNILYSTATDMGASGRDDNFGYGRVNALAALQAAGGSAPTCSDGVQNGQETGVDCGGPSCPPCQTGCSDNEVSLTLNFDNYPEETSWAITNAAGNTVASGGTYGSQADGSTLTEDLCLVDGCYDLTISDSYGDGMCCSYGNGSYSLSDGSTTLASGGSFGASETTNFCLGGGGADTQAPSTPSNLQASNIGTTTLDLSWNASSDNVAVTGYNILVDGQNIGTTTSTSAAITGLSPATTYTFGISAYDEAGNTSGTATTTATTQSEGGGSADSTVILAHYFESGWDGWADGGSDCYRYSGTRSWEGNYSIRIRDNSGVQSAMTSPTYDLSTYSSVKIKFYFYAYSMENGEDFWVRYNDGSGWQTVATYARGSSFDNNSFYSAVVTLDPSQVNLSSSGQFRFQCDASANGDQIYIDQVTVTGYGPAATLADYVDGVHHLGTLDESPTESNLQLYPNPTRDLIHVQMDEEVIEAVQLYSIDGKLLRQRNVADNAVSLDIKDLKVGLYILSIQTDEGNYTEQIVKN